MEDLEIVYPTSDDPIPAPSTPPKKNKKAWRKKKKTSSPTTTSPGMDETTSPWSAMEKRSYFSDPKPRANLGEVPSPKSTVSFICFLNKI